MNHDFGHGLDNHTAAVLMSQIERRQIEQRQLMPLQDLPEIRAQLSLRPGDYNPHAVPCCNRFAYCC